MSVAPPFPFRPATRNVSSGRPASGTSFISIPRSVPTSTTSLSLPRESHSFAIASAGITWPPVPPPAIRSFMGGALAVGGTDGHGVACPYDQKVFATCPGGSCFGGLLTNVQEDAG